MKKFAAEMNVKKIHTSRPTFQMVQQPFVNTKNGNEKSKEPLGDLCSSCRPDLGKRAWMGRRPLDGDGEDGDGGRIQLTAQPRPKKSFIYNQKTLASACSGKYPDVSECVHLHPHSLGMHVASPPFPLVIGHYLLPYT